MTPTPPPGSASSDEAAPAAVPEAANSADVAGRVRLGPVLAATHLSWMLPVAASTTLIQARLGQLDPATKLSHYAVIATVCAFIALVTNIGFGLLSDRTRSRWGRRNPWILAGSVGAAACISAMSLTRSFPVLVLLAIGFQVFLNAMVASLSAVLPDRVAAERMGRASSWIGLGQLLGQSLAAVIAGLLVTAPELGLRWLPWLMVLGGVFFCLAAPDTSTAGQPRPDFSWRELGRTLLPPRDADFFWALIGRLLVLLGVAMVLVYQLFVLTDYLHLTTTRAGAAIALGGVVTAVASGVAIAVGGPLSDRLGRRKVFILAASVAGAGAMVPLALSPTLSSFYLLVSLAGLGFGCFLAVDQAVVAEILPSQDNRARDLGFLNIANTVPSMLAPLIAGAVVPAFGYPTLFVIAVVTTLVGGLCILPIRRVA